MKVVQVSIGLSYGDGISNCVLSIARMLDELGYSNSIITYSMDRRIKESRIIEGSIYDPIVLDDDDIIIYHLGAGNVLNYIVEHLPYKKILVYQNVTIPEFYRGIDYQAMQLCLWGICDARNTAGNYLKGIVLSDFSKKDLVEMGWKSKDISILPLININGAAIEANSKLINKYDDDYVNILFTGRIEPHKKIEDIIKGFWRYQKEFNTKSRLFLVGRAARKKYYQALQAYIQQLNVDNVVFTGHVLNEDLEAYYAIADVFLCMSEHEGFCIPLVEAMKRKIPIVAYSAAAVPDTLGEAGVLVHTKDEREIAGIMDRLISDLDYKEEIVQSQNQRLNFLGLENYKSKLKDLIEEVAQIKEYSYAFESKETFALSLGEVKPDYIYSLKQLQKNFEKVIIYGIGRVGKKFLRESKEVGKNFLDKVIICDNMFPEHQYDHIDVLKHEQCVTKYPEALYIITVQNAYIDIIAELLSSNIAKENIRFYNVLAEKIF